MPLSGKPINFYISCFPIMEIYQLNLIIRNYRPNVVALAKFSDIERFVIRTDGSGKTFNNRDSIPYPNAITLK